MKMRRFSVHAAPFTMMLVAAGCSTFAAESDPSPSVREEVASVAADARPAPGRGGLRAESAGSREGGWARAPFIAPLERADTLELAPGAVLEVWLSDRGRDLRTIASERALGTAVVHGDFFRYTSVNADPDLRGFWGQPLLLRWSAILEITERGQHVFALELSKERGNRAMQVRTLVRLNEETVFERQVRVTGLGNSISEPGSHVAVLAPGFYRLEVWLSLDTRSDLPPSSQLGTFIRLREPSAMTPAPLPSSRLWHRVR
jgi:hypothetical protein